MRGRAITEAEKETLRRLYPTGTREEITAALGGRSWATIKKLASRFHIKRPYTVGYRQWAGSRPGYREELVARFGASYKPEKGVRKTRPAGPKKGVMSAIVSEAYKRERIRRSLGLGPLTKRKVCDRPFDKAEWARARNLRSRGYEGSGKSWRYGPGTSRVNEALYSARHGYRFAPVAERGNGTAIPDWSDRQGGFSVE